MGSSVALLGGGGIRTPQLIHGLAEAADALSLDTLRLYDIDSNRAAMMAALGGEIARRMASPLRVMTSASIEEAVSGARFVLSSIRVGGIEARARDEAIAVRHGRAGQETTGPGGWAMALRTIPVALSQARVVEREAPGALFVTFTNPAGLITQAITTQTRVRATGICDTPSELFHQIAAALGAAPGDVECEYLGLNHLGWVRRVLLNGVDVTASLLADDSKLRGLYPAPLFDPALIRQLGTIPSEYLFFYYAQRRAYRNQLTASTTRGAEVSRLNATLLGDLEAEVARGDLGGALETYRLYLRRRSGSYMQLEGKAGSIASSELQADDPLQAPTGYHRVAIQVMRAMHGLDSRPIVVNTPNRGAIDGFADDDVVEAPVRFYADGARPVRMGALPEPCRGLAFAVKQYERTTIRAAVEQSAGLARMALFLNPIVGDWDLAAALAADFGVEDPALRFLGGS